MGEGAKAADDSWKEECGVSGVYCLDGHSAAPYVHIALYALQHRGQESAGIAAFDQGEMHLHRGMGLVAQVFDHARIAALPGTAAIGHVRYATMGSARIENAQPFVVPSPWGPVAISHNGNLINAPQLRRELEAQGVRMQATTDSEMIAHLIARAPVRGLDEAIAYCMRRIEGAYTVAALAGGRLFGFSDAHAIRPLAVGRGPSFWALASETCAFDHTGAEFVCDVEPGQLVMIDALGLRAQQVLDVERRANCVFEYIYFARPDSVLRGRNVHSARRRMGRVLAREHPVTADIVIAVPDSGTSAAMGFAEVAGLPFEVGLIKNRYVGRTFITPDQSSRDFGVRLKLNPTVEAIEGRRVVLVDDSIVRGTTSGRIVRLLRAAGAREVHVRISSPPIRHACYYGIDTSNRGELIASRLDVEAIRREIGADSLGYLSQHGLVEAVGQPASTLCMACLDGRYPTRTPSEEDAGRTALDAFAVATAPAGQR
ncbi:MAG: amidophosphoribosyltransferase [Armatimonadota bacterium]|nr:amidophosphoribosyltransferase [Armatimonadota bacterium]